MPAKPIRPIRIEGNIAYVPLTQGHEAIVDVDDLPIVQGYNWSARLSGKNVYAQRADWQQGTLSIVTMHRAIMCAPSGVEVDHENCNGLDNRRLNLRLATHQQNAWNTPITKANSSGFKGVSWNKQKRKWEARISAGESKKFLGYFDAPEAAHAAYCKAAKQHHGQFRRVK